MRKCLLIISVVLLSSGLGCNGSPLQPTSSESPVGAGRAAPSNPEEPTLAAVAVDLPTFGNEEIRFDVVGVGAGTLQVRSSGRGIFSHAGQTTSVSEYTVNLLTGASAGNTTLTSANGDQTFSTWTSLPISQTTRLFAVSIVGGTGRFQNATGSMTGTTTITSTDAGGGTAKASWTGTISY